MSTGQFVQAVSGSSSRPGSSRSSLMRLPDEPPTPTEVVTSPSRQSWSWPGNGGLSRLPDDPLVAQVDGGATGSGSRPGSRSGLLKLPDEAIAPPAAPCLPASSRLEPEVSRPERRPGGLRDRFRKDLSVRTDAIEELQNSKHKAFFRELGPHESVNDLYETAEEIYSGGAKGKVMTATRKSDGAQVVMKIRSKRTNKGGERSWRAIMDQMYQLQGSDHVLDINEILEDGNHFYIIMPKCDGGELFEFLVTETEVPEAECKRIIREILIAVGTLHKQGLVHRDVKPENIMFDVDLASKTPKTVKLIDFDTCVEWTPASPKSARFVGTPGYIAPEALLGEISPKSDLWSIGVILYILMTGETPWSSMVSLEDGTVGSPGAKRMWHSLKDEVFEWEREPWPDFPAARDLCQRLLAFDQTERPDSVDEVLEHAWLSASD